MNQILQRLLNDTVILFYPFALIIAFQILLAFNFSITLSPLIFIDLWKRNLRIHFYRIKLSLYKLFPLLKPNFLILKLRH